LIRVKRTTSAGADRGHSAAWFEWHGGVILICARGHRAVLRTATVQQVEAHEIADDGTVTPSVQCFEPGCDFHENIVLEDWQPMKRLRAST
jgi:hypothetical protein